MSSQDALAITTTCLISLKENDADEGPKVADELVKDYKQLNEKCEKILKRVKSRKAGRSRAKKSTK